MNIPIRRDESLVEEIIKEEIDEALSNVEETREEMTENIENEE